MNSDKLSSETLTTLFTSIKNKEFSGETNNLEFKKSFGHKSYPEYMKTMAAFANTSGGYLFFGIHDSTQELLGLQGVAHSEFKNLDNAKLANFLRDQFNRDIRWGRKLFTYDQKEFGVVYVFELTNKPVISKKQYDILKKSEIYYRYNGVSTVIEPGDLEDIIEKEKHRLVSELLNKIQLIGNLGVENTSILSLKGGKILSSSESPANIIVDPEAIEKIKFIQEGHFTETDGEPTLILKGVVQNVIPSNSIIVNTPSPTAISIPEIVETFLKEDWVENPVEYLKSICRSPSSNYPIYFYVKYSDKTVEEIVNELNEIEIIGSTKILDEVISRLEKGKTYYKPIRTAGKISASIREYQLRLLHQTISSSDVLDNRERKVKYILQAVQAINSGEIRKNKDYYLELLENIFRNVFSKENCDSQTKTEFRKAICWVDEALYKSNDK